MHAVNKVLAANGIDNVEGSNKSKYVKLKIRRLENQKFAKSQKLFKSRKSKGEKSKKPLKVTNLPNFNTKKAGLSFQTFDTKTPFNHLQLALTKAPIF